MSTPWGEPHGPASPTLPPAGSMPYPAPYPSPYPSPYPPGEPPAAPWHEQLRGQTRPAAALLAAGLLLGGVWALAAPRVAGAGDPSEARVAVDGLLALLQVGAGAVTAVVVALAPGLHRVARLAVVLVAATLAGLLAAGVGLARGLELHAPGAALLWPLAASVLTAARLLVGLIGSPDGGAAAAARRHA